MEKKTHLSSDHSFTVPSPPPVARFTPEEDIERVALGCQASPRQ